MANKPNNLKCIKVYTGLCKSLSNFPNLLWGFHHMYCALNVKEDNRYINSPYLWMMYGNVVNFVSRLAAVSKDNRSVSPICIVATIFVWITANDQDQNLLSRLEIINGCKSWIQTR